ncbi:MAG: acetate--CoA ligase family protein [Thermoguttaceae bacterium]|nr:acetate--CoA ligase family protein [Thermoguttaceae bacterium]MDW8039631.1 acetate--CoA ligase family protein [Thermoguttaceae bacterium]
MNASAQSVSNNRHPLDSIFSPKSVAVVGVTATPGTVPYDIFYNILTSGYRGTLYPVAPGKRSICAVRAYRYVIDIDDQVDLAVIVFPAEVVDRALEQCGKKGIKAAIVISAGFREIGPEGVRREERLKAICAEYGISLIGPNCLGVINTDPAVRLNASFARRMPLAGRIAFLSQSGALCTAVLDYAREKQIGFSKFVSFGNKAGVTETDLLDYLHQDPQTDVILLYLEELREGRKLVEVARRVTRGPNAKPILAIKSGRTPQGADAAASHTGSLASEDPICDAVFQEAGIVRVNTIEEMFNAAILYAYQPMPQGNRLAIVTNAGGPGVMATDAAVSMGLAVPRLSETTQQRLRESLPATANVKNPVDVIGDARADRYQAALRHVLDDPQIDQVLVILTPQSMTDIEAIAHGIVGMAKNASKPIACSFMGAEDVAPGIRVLQDAHVPHYLLPEWACAAMAAVQRIRTWRALELDEPEPLPVDQAAAASILDQAPPGYLEEPEALAVLAAYGLPVPPHRLCTSPEEAAEFAEQIGYPVVLRVVSPQVVHKWDVGGVRLNLQNSEAVRSAFTQMLQSVRQAVPQAEIRGAVVRRMIPPGHEVILGAKRDPSFGPVIMFGLGGLYVELFKDVTFALAPVSRHSAQRMLQHVKAFKLLEGLRGSPPADVENIRECIQRLSQLVADFPRISELDVNPLIVGPRDRGNMVADVRIRLS